MNRRYKTTDDELRAAVASCISIAQVLRALGIRVAGGNYITIKRRVADLGLDTSHWLGPAHLRGRTHNWARPRSLQDVLRPGSRYCSNDLKKRLLKEGIFPPGCSGCFLTQWRDAAIPLELDHIDGDAENNALFNLRLLCPNCHAQTPTYRARNTRYAHIPPFQEIIKGIDECGGVAPYAERLGVSRDVVRRWLNSARVRRLAGVKEPRVCYVH